MSNEQRTLPDEESEHPEAVPEQLPVGLAIRRRSNSVALANGLATANERNSCLSIRLSEPPGSLIEQSSSENDQSNDTVECESGALSPQYTLVNSDRASMRVHTGSIRERYMQQIAAINEDDSDAVSGYYTTGSSVYQQQQQQQQQQYFMDGVSMLSGLSEDGASTARVRIATTNAYNALRIGPQPASLFSGYSGRITSYAASSDPGGLASPSSFYDMQFADYNDHSSSNSISNDIARSDVAVYSGTSEDVKFPFLPDNISEFSGPFIHSSAGAVDRSDYSYPAQLSYHSEHMPPMPRIVRRSKKLKKRAGTTPPDYAMPASTSAHPWNHILPRHSSAAKYRAASAATSNAAPGTSRQSDSQSNRTPSRAVNSTAIRPNVIMRFFKRIAPRN
ncbi:hypothetical protein EV183_005493 [Coemansia sp. RSA 2336]|nr:hypothetical protein EV183_005493 [Coemansia sp. RSA 2336]